MAFPSISDPLRRRRGDPQMAPSSIDPYARHAAPGAAGNIASMNQSPAATAINRNANDKAGGADSLEVRQGRNDTNKANMGDNASVYGDSGGAEKPLDDGNDKEPDNDPDDLDNLEEGFIRKSLDPAATDTTEEEALVNQKILDQLGGNLVDQRARMGRAGFGASGALAGLEGDTMRKANQDAASSIYDIREREQNQAFQQGQAATQLDIQKQAEAAREAEAQAQYEAIQALLGGGPDPAADPNAGGNGDTAGAQFLGTGETGAHASGNVAEDTHGGDVNNTQLHRAVGYESNGWVIVDYKNGKPVWANKKNPSQQFNGDDPPTGTVQGGPSNPQAPGA